MKDIADSSSDLFGMPLLGGSKKNQFSGPFPKETEFKYLVGCINNEDFRSQAEDIKTRSYRCSGYLKVPGDVCLISETGTFDREGYYNVVMCYAILPEKDTETGTRQSDSNNKK